MLVFRDWTLLLCAIAAVGLLGCEQSDDPTETPQPDVVSDASDPEAVSAQSAEALAFCEALGPPDPGPVGDFPGIHLLGLDLNPDRDNNFYVASFDSVDGVADIKFPMAVCPLTTAGKDNSPSFKGVRCELWVGGISDFDRVEIVVVEDYEPCEFSSVPVGEHDLNINLCCFNDCSNGLNICNYGEAWVDVIIE